eukprot:366082-Chlamydomonas_euryale.AAC.21
MSLYSGTAKLQPAGRGTSGCTPTEFDCQSASNPQLRRLNMRACAGTGREHGRPRKTRAWGDGLYAKQPTTNYWLNRVERDGGEQQVLEVGSIPRVLLRLVDSRCC